MEQCLLGGLPMNEKIYTTKSDEPVEAASGETTKAGMPKPWNVYRHIHTQVCCVAGEPPAGHTHLHGPDTWQQCWAYINTKCQPSGAVFYC
jgi:hypothetical protein